MQQDKQPFPLERTDCLTIHNNSRDILKSQFMYYYIINVPFYYFSKMKPIPKPVFPNAPVIQSDRQHYINSLIALYKSQANLPKTEIVAKCVALEYGIASNNKQKGEYLSQIKRLMFNLKKYGSESGKPLQNVNTVDSVRGKHGDVYDFDKVFNHLKFICISRERLQRHGVVMEQPDLLPLPDLVNCDHCQREFKPSQIKLESKCTFHPGKIQTSTYENIKLGKKIYGTQYTDRAFTCCKQQTGQSTGCKSLNHHVFKLKNSGELQTVKPFKSITQLRRQFGITNDSNIQKKRAEKIKAIGLDCEMCYTNKGFEMMKISISDFKTEKPLLNSIVHPDGDLIIDLNSHVSGVDEIPQSALTFDELLVKLAELTDENTIIVGHGLENDLNVLRMIYPLIVDTAIILSDNQVDVRRKDPLKKLAWDYLSENIQSGSHDSLEDAIIPIKIIKKYIVQRLDRIKY